MQKIGKFGMNNPDIAVNVLLNSENGIHTARRSELDRKSSKQANLLMIVDEENRHYTAIKYMLRFL